MAVVGNECKERASESAKKALQMSPSVQYAIVKIMPNILNGAFWGFTTMQEVKSHYEAIMKSDGHLIARKLGNACLIEANPDFLVKAIQTIDPNALTRKDMDVMQKARAEATVAFERFLINKGKKLSETGQLFGGTIGIYCVNDDTSMTYKGISYPSFRVDAGTALQLLQKWGYRIQIKGKFVSAGDAMNAGTALWDSMTLSPTKSGLFISIKATLDVEQVKAMEKQWKAQNGVTR